MVNPKLKSRAPPPREGDPTGPRFAAEEETSQKGPRLSPAGGGGRLGLAMERKLSPPDHQLAGDHVAPIKLHLGDRDPIGPALAKLSHKYCNSKVYRKQSRIVTTGGALFPRSAIRAMVEPCGVLDPGRPAQSPRRPCPGLRGIFPISVEARKKKAPRLSPAGPLADVVLLADLCSRRGSTMADNG